MRTAIVLVLVVVAASLVASGCAQTQSGEAIEEARAQGVALEKARQKAVAEKERQKARQKALNERIRRLEAQQKRAAKQAEAAKRRAAQAAAARPPAPAPVPSPGTSCGGGLSVGPITSCAFASEVRSAWYAQGGGSTTVFAESPVTGRMYSMYCSAGAPTVCRGGNNAVVYIH